MIKKTIKADLKHLGLKLKGGIIYKKNIGFSDLPLGYTDKELFLYLRGMSNVFDNKELFKG